MNKFIGVGRLTKDPEVRHSQGDNPIAIARYTMAIDRRIKKDGEQSADFIPCICFGKSAEFAEKYLKQGMKIAIAGRIQTGSYTNKDGAKVYTTEVVVEEHEFAGAKTDGNTNNSAPRVTDSDGFMSIPQDLDSDELPFN